ncbi:MAG: cyclic nucleotide-binding domain-containing protein, partial [Candidatus Binatia bacterium]
MSVVSPRETVASLLGATPMFAELPPPELEALAALAETQYLESGECLYSEGEPPEYFYVVASGRLRVTQRGSLLGYVGRLEPVGEMGVVTGEPRTSHVHAVRDSLLLRIARDPLLDLLNRNGPTLMAATRLMLKRLRQYQRQRRLAATESHGTFSILPASSGAPVMALAETLVRRLAGWPAARLITARHVDAALGSGAAQAPFSDRDASRRLMAWLNELEGRHRYVIYAGDNHGDAWALRCLR